MASTQCPNCGSKFKIPDEKAAKVSGKSVKCTKCEDRFVIVLDTNTQKSVVTNPKPQSQQIPEKSPNLKEESLLFVEEGIRLIDQGNYTGAENILKKAIEFDPSNAVAYVSMGKVFYAKERYQEAITWFEKALKINPNIQGLSDLLEKSKKRSSSLSTQHVTITPQQI